jgi:protein O-GlcNAc transferase
MAMLTPNADPFANPGSAQLLRQLGPSSALRHQVRQFPNDIPLRIQLAVALDNEGQPGEAEDVLREALQRGLKKPEIYHALGMLYMRNGVYYGAAEMFSLETKLAPKSYQAHLNLAQAYVYMNQNEAAAKHFEKANQLDPSQPDAYLGLALINNTSERYPYAVQYLQEFIKRAPSPGQGYALLSRVYLNMREYDKAMEAGRKATQALPNDPACWYNLGQAYAYNPSEKYFQEAVQAYERTLQMAPQWGGAHFELGRVYERLNRKEEAVARYRDAVRYQPSNGRFRYQLGRLLMQIGQVEEGQRETQLAQPLIRLNQRETQLTAKIASNPKEPSYVYELGVVYKELKEYKKALDTFEFLLKMAPNYPKARQQWEETRRLVSSPR